MKLFVIRDGAGLCNNSDLGFSGALPLVIGTEVDLIAGPNVEVTFSVCKVSVLLHGTMRDGWIAESSLGYRQDIVTGDDAKVRLAIDYTDLYSRDTSGVLSTSAGVILSPGTSVKVISANEEGFLNGHKLPLYKVKVIRENDLRTPELEGWVRKLHLKPVAEEYSND